MSQLKVLGSPRCVATRKTWEILEKLSRNFEKIDILSITVPKWVLSKVVMSSDIGAAFNHHHPAWQKLRNHRFTKASAIAFLQKHPELIRRPIIIKGKEVIQGYDEEEIRKFVR